MKHFVRVATLAFALLAPFSAYAQSDLYVTTSGNVGIGTSTATDELDVNGGLGLSTTTSTLPLNGLYSPAANQLSLTTSGITALTITTTQSIGIGTTTPSSNLQVSGSTNTTTMQLNSLEVPLPPGGVLALTAAGAFFPADVTAATTVYYVPTQAGQNVPIYNGSHWQEYDIGSSGISLSMATTANFPTSEIFDVYAFSNSGSATLCGIYWGGSTRSSSAGGKSGTQDVTIVQKNGLYVNHAAFASGNCYNNNTSYTPSANQATLVGSFRTSAAGQTEWKCHPAAASGGSAVDMAVYNVFNQQAYSCTNIDDGSQYTYTTATPRPSRNNTNNEMHYLDGLGTTNVSGEASTLVENTGNAGNCGYLALALNSTTTPGSVQVGAVCGNSNFDSVSTNASYAGALGYNYLVTLESALFTSTTNTETFNPGNQTLAGFANTGCLSATITVRGM